MTTEQNTELEALLTELMGPRSGSPDIPNRAPWSWGYDVDSDLVMSLDKWPDVCVSTCGEAIQAINARLSQLAPVGWKIALRREAIGPFDFKLEYWQPNARRMRECLMINGRLGARISEALAWFATRENPEPAASGNAVETVQRTQLVAIIIALMGPQNSDRGEAYVDRLIAAVRAESADELADLRAKVRTADCFASLLEQEIAVLRHCATIREQEIHELRARPAVAKRGVVAMTSHGDRVLVAYDDGSFECATVPPPSRAFEPPESSGAAVVSKTEITEEAAP